MLKHNKKRNIGLMVEFLSRNIANSILESRTNDVEKAKSFWIQKFTNNPELVKEYTLFNTLYSTSVKNHEMAVSLIEKVKKSYRSIDFNKLEEQKTRFIHEVHDVLNDKHFFNRSVENYKMMATIGTLFSAWRNEDRLEDLQTTALLEDKVLSHLLEDKKQQLSSAVLKLKTDDVDALVVRIMKEKFEKKYENSLNDLQKKIVNLYVLSNDDQKLEENLQHIFKKLQAETLDLINEEVAVSKDEQLKKKLNEVSHLISEAYSDTSYIDDDVVVFHMTLAKMLEELRTK